MKALIPSGGAGMRLRPITHTSAKQLVPVANKPILHYVIEDVAEAGVLDVGIVVGDTAEQVRASVGDGSAWGVRVTYIEQDAPRGLAHTVLIARDFLGAEPFVMYLGDNLLRDGIAEIVEEFRRDPVGARILVSRVPEPERFGVVEVEGDRAVRLVEKPPVPASDLALVGVYLFDATIHDAVRAIEPSARGELEITDAIQTLVDTGARVRVTHVDGWWKDTGRLVDLLDANRLVLQSLDAPSEGVADDGSTLIGKVILQRGALVEQSTIQGPAIIGVDARISHSSIGPYTAIGARCVVERAEVEHSIVLEDCVITNVHRLEDSLLGRGVVVDQSRGRPKAFRMMVGDHGRVEAG